MAIALDQILGTVTDNASITLAEPVAPGARIVLATWWYDGPPQGVLQDGSWGGGLEWKADFQNAAVAAGPLAFGSAYAPDGLADSAVITPSLSTAPIDFGPGIAAISFTGLDAGPTGHVEDTAEGTESFAAAWTCNSALDVAGDAVVIGFTHASPNSLTHTADTGNGWIEFAEWQMEGGNRGAVVYKIVGAGAHTPGGTWSATPDFEMDIGIAYKAAAGGPPPAAPKLAFHRPPRGLG